MRVFTRAVAAAVAVGVIAFPATTAAAEDGVIGRTEAGVNNCVALVQFFGVSGATLCAQSSAPNTALAVANLMTRTTTEEATLATMTVDTLANGSLLDFALGTIQGVQDSTVTAVEAGTDVGVSAGGAIVSTTTPIVGTTTAYFGCRPEIDAVDCVPVNTNDPLALPTRPLSTGGSEGAGGDFVQNLEYVNTGRMSYDCRNACGANFYNLYKAQGETSAELDFWAVSMESSVGIGRNGYGITQINTAVESNSNGLEIMSSSPRGIEEYGTADSVNVGASAGVRGATLSISRTWDRPKGQAGGATRENRHTVVWKSRDGAQRSEKALDGVNLWRVPAGTAISFGISAGVYYK